MTASDEAREAIGTALEGWVESLPFEGDPASGVGILGDWICVMAMVDVDRKDGLPRAQYYIAMRDGSMLGHVAKGLLAQGMEELNGMVDQGDDDSDS